MNEHLLRIVTQMASACNDYRSNKVSLPALVGTIYSLSTALDSSQPPEFATAVEDFVCELDDIEFVTDEQVWKPRALEEIDRLLSVMSRLKLLDDQCLAALVPTQTQA